jgi:shikimate dehydrogenase
MRLFGLIGKSLSHSFSQAYFEEKFRREGILDAAYSLFELENIGLVTALIQEHPDLIGFNVTIPYKQQIIPLLDELSEEAATVGAVNTVVIQRINNQIHTVGHNTDIIGFQKSLQGIKLPDCALVLGTGGAAAAVNYVLKSQGCACTAVSRDPKRGFPYSALTADIVAQHRLIVNCTPLGTFPDVNGKPDIPYEGVSSNHFLYDLVYNPAETAFLKEGKLRGAHTCNGLPMLHAQAEAAWQLVNPSFFSQ